VEILHENIYLILVSRKILVWIISLMKLLLVFFILYYIGPSYIQNYFDPSALDFSVRAVPFQTYFTVYFVII
jgi:hypothetical protein